MKNIVYIEVDQGDLFGQADLIESAVEKDCHLKEVLKDSSSVKRTFTVQALTNVELLSMTVEILNKMTKDFPAVFEQLFKDS
jgi:CRP-like cAMP-binding protein